MRERLTIYLDEHMIRAGNIEKVRQTLDPILDNSAVLSRYEAAISLAFGSSSDRRLGFFEIEKRMNNPTYKHWFQHLDVEIPVLPYFLSDEEGKSALLTFLMGVLSYTVRDNRIVFDQTEVQRYVSRKGIELKNFCLSNNIDPSPTLKRLTAILCPSGEKRRKDAGGGPEQIPLFAAATPAEAPAPTTPAATPTLPAEPSAPPEPPAPPASPAPRQNDAYPLKGLLDRFGSIAVFKENRMTKLFLVFDEVPAQLSLIENRLVEDRSRNYWFFRTKFGADTGERTVESLLLFRPDEVADSIRRHGGVLLVCIHRDADGDYQKLFELEEPVPTEIVQEWGTPTEVAPARAAPPPEPEPAREAPSDEPPTPVEPAPSPPAEVGAPEDPRDRRIAELEAEVARLKGVIETYEEALAKKQRGFWRKLFG